VEALVFTGLILGVPLLAVVMALRGARHSRAWTRESGGASATFGDAGGSSDCGDGGGGGCGDGGGGGD
jgi:hypothetical protein